MRKISVFVLVLLLSAIAFAQTPDKMSFQTVVRNSQGKLVVNQTIGVRLSILKRNKGDEIVYRETQTKQTNSNGLLTLEIGKGVADIFPVSSQLSSDYLANIDWSQGVYSLKTELDLVGGTNYSITGFSEFTSVPYAFQANSANSVKSLSDGQSVGDMNYWDGMSWVPLKKGTQGQSLTFCDGKPAWVVGGICPGTVQSFNCASANHSGTLINGVTASGISTQLGYTGGNQGPYHQVSIPSTGVLGLTATIPSGVFALDAGSITLAITGKPTSTGVASFELTLGGVTCTISRNVVAGAISTMNCATPTNAGSLTRGVAASGVTSTIAYTGGNQGSYEAQMINSTGVDGLTAKLTAGNFANGSGSLVFSISGNSKTAGVASFQVTVGGVSCSFTRTVNQPAAAITSVLCTQIQHRGYLTASKLSSAESDVPYTGGNGGTYSAFSVVSTGITGLTAKISTGLLAEGDGRLTYQITGTPSGVGTASFNLNIGGSSCLLSRTILPIGVVSGLNCVTATNNGKLVSGVEVSEVSTLISYLGGNAGTYNGHVIASTGVTGLTATLSDGVFANGNGSLFYAIKGKPSSSGTASFTITVGGKTCSFTRIVNPTSGYGLGVSDASGIQYKSVFIGEQEWMAENLRTTKYSDGSIINGSNTITNSNWYSDQMAKWCNYGNSSSNDLVYGKLYNWYVINPASNGNKNVCPTGWHVPSLQDWNLLITYIGGSEVAGGLLKDASQATSSWLTPNTNATDFYKFKALPGGIRGQSGVFDDLNYYGYFWTSTEFNEMTSEAKLLLYQFGKIESRKIYKSDGISIRCIKD